MMYRISLLLILSCVNNIAFADCDSADTLGAKYKISSTHSESNKTTIRDLVLWRNGKAVAHQYPDTQITELWELSGNGMLRLVRNFDAYKRGIEYHPGEINNGKGDKDWKLKYQLVSTKLMKKMQLEKSTGKDCRTIEYYSLNESDAQIKLLWLPRLQLLKKLQVTKADEIIQWNLEDIVTDKAAVSQVFTSRSSYQTTDYIDIGDNESDPFLLKMINLGFVEHGSSGFYDAQGHALDGHRQHKH